MWLPPSPALASTAIAGAVVGCLTDVAATDALACASASVATAVAARAGRTRRALVLVCVAGLAGAGAARARDAALAPVFDRWTRPVTAGGDAARDPPPVLVAGRVARDGWLTDDGVGLLIDVDAVRDRDGEHVVRGRVLAFVAGQTARDRAAAWSAGRRVQVWASLRAVGLNRNPGAPGERFQRLSRAHVAWGSVKSGLRVEVEPGSVLTEATAAVRRYVRGAAARLIGPLDGQPAAVVVAILIGDRAGLDPDTERRLQVAGTYHVIAISGGNVALVAACCFGVLGVFIRSRPAVSLLTCGVVVGYGFVVGDDPSVQRAVTAGCLLLVAHAIGLKPQPVHLLSAAAAVLVFARPLMVIDVGAWLSFGATLGIIVCAGRLAGSRGRRPAAPGRSARRLVRTFVVLPVVMVMAATVAAELFILPVQANVFSRVGVAGVALNVVALPAMAAVQLAGLATVVLADLSPPAAAVAGGVARWAAGILIGSASVVDVAPWLSWRVPPAGLAVSVVYYVLLAATLRLPAGRWRKVAIGSAMLAGVILATGPAVGRLAPAPGMVRLTVLDVGQGEAVVVQLPGRRALLVDTGGAAGDFDLGGRVLVPALWALGVRRLDWLLVTHPDRDHAGAAPAVIADLRPREVWLGVPVPGHEEHERMITAARGVNASRRMLRAGDVLDVGDARLEVLHPPVPDWERRAVRNDDSVVIRLVFGQVEVLFAGDAGREFETSYFGAGETPLRVLKVGHHGSRSSSEAAFLGRVRPDLALLSAGSGNVFGHPHPEVLARLAGVRATVFRTDRDGAITIETDGRSVDVRAASGRRWHLVLSGGAVPS